MKSLAGSSWIDALPSEPESPRLTDLARSLFDRVASRFAAINLQYVDPWERKRLQP